MTVDRVRSTRLLALVVVAVLGFAASLPSADLSAAEPQRFAFKTSLLDHTFGAPQRLTRDVHFELEHIRPWIASVGAAAAVGDVDGNLKADDTCYVDTRTNKVVVAPLLPAHTNPGLRGNQSDFEPFALDPPDGRSREDTTVAPMGCLIGDMNEDGAADLLVYFWGRPPALYLGTTNRQEPLGRQHFRGKTIINGEAWFTNAALLADIDGDGHLDVVIGNYFCDGGRILDASPGTRACPSGRPPMQDSMSRAFNAGVNRILLARHSKNGESITLTFVEVVPFEREVAKGWTLAIGARNLLSDGDTPDLYFANDFGPDRLMVNCSRAVQRFGTAEERAAFGGVSLSDSPSGDALQESVRRRLGCTPIKGPVSFALLEGTRSWGKPRSNVLGQDSFKGMGVDFGDIDGDGIPDIYISNITERWALQESQNLYLSGGVPLTGALVSRHKAPYVDEAERLGLSRSGWAWDAKLADFDNDGRLEALQAVGFVRGTKAGPDLVWRKSCWANLQELATANDRLLAVARSWFRMEHGANGIGCDLSGDSRRNPFFAQPRLQSVLARPEASSGLLPRFQDLSGVLDHLSRRVAPTRGIAIADANQDGLLDYVEAKQYAPHEFHLNTAKASGKFVAFTPLFQVTGDKARPTRFMSYAEAREAKTRAAIGVQFVIELADPRGGRTVVHRAEVDGGNGHSGKRSHDIHFGVGDVPADTRVTLRARWLSSDGAQSRTLEGSMADFQAHRFLLL